VRFCVRRVCVTAGGVVKRLFMVLFDRSAAAVLLHHISTCIHRGGIERFNVTVF
jgi:hypothetical protein